MRIWIHKHPILLATATAAVTFAATVAVVNYYLNSILILPLI